jgi:hypothetical protein
MKFCHLKSEKRLYVMVCLHWNERVGVQNGEYALKLCVLHK